MKIVYSDEFERALRKWKKKDHYLFEQLVNKMERIINEPTIGKPPSISEDAYEEAYKRGELSFYLVGDKDVISTFKFIK